MPHRALCKCIFQDVASHGGYHLMVDLNAASKTYFSLVQIKSNRLDGGRDWTPQ